MISFIGGYLEIRRVVKPNCRVLPPASQTLRLVPAFGVVMRNRERAAWAASGVFAVVISQAVLRAPDIAKMRPHEIRAGLDRERRELPAVRVFDNLRVAHRRDAQILQLLFAGVDQLVRRVRPAARRSTDIASLD